MLLGTYLCLAWDRRASRRGEVMSERGKGPTGVAGRKGVSLPSRQGSIVPGGSGKRTGATGDCCKSALLKEGVVVLVRFWVGN